MASSTTMPMATANPPRVIEFTLTRTIEKRAPPRQTDQRHRINVIAVVRTLNRKRNSTIATMIARLRSLPSSCDRVFNEVSLIETSGRPPRRRGSVGCNSFTLPQYEK
jgi:hypothetical protein